MASEKKWIKIEIKCSELRMVSWWCLYKFKMCFFSFCLLEFSNSKHKAVWISAYFDHFPVSQIERQRIKGTLDGNRKIGKTPLFHERIISIMNCELWIVHEPHIEPNFRMEILSSVDSSDRWWGKWDGMKTKFFFFSLYHSVSL